MGKKRIIKKSGGEGEGASKAASRATKKKIEHGLLYVKSTYNNTTLTLTDAQGNVLLWSSSGSMGYKGAKKGTPFAAGKVGDVLSEKAQGMGLKEVDVIIRGVGAGRESAMRAFTAKGIGITSIRDTTPVPFNGPKPRKPRRV
jgi:small subunit ribosomal protein S11